MTVFYLAMERAALHDRPALEVVSVLAGGWKGDRGRLQQMPLDAYLMTCKDLLRHKIDPDIACDGHIV